MVMVLIDREVRTILLDQATILASGRIGLRRPQTLLSGLANHIEQTLQLKENNHPNGLCEFGIVIALENHQKSRGPIFKGES